VKMENGRDIGHLPAIELIGRKFSPAGLSAEESVSLRGHLASCGSCRSRYDERVAMLRVASGSGEHEPLGLESRLLMEETFSRMGKESPEREGGWDFLRAAHWVLGSATALLLVVLAAQPLLYDGRERTRPVSDHEFLSRGSDAVLPAVGIGLSGIDPEGREYEVVESDGACLQDALRFYVTARKQGYVHYFLFGIQDNERILWYFPLPEEGNSYQIPATRTVAHMVPYELELQERHAAGSLTVYGVFSKQPLSFTDVAARVERLVRSAGGLAGPRLRDALDRLAPKGVLTTSVSLSIISCGGDL